MRGAEQALSKGLHTVDCLPVGTAYNISPSCHRNSLDTDVKSEKWDAGGLQEVRPPQSTIAIHGVGGDMVKTYK